MNQFSKPPVISRDRIYGICAEGEVQRNEDINTFSLAVDAYGFLVAPGEVLTGSQWVCQIGRQYDVTIPRNAEVVAAVTRTMLCAEFADDFLAMRNGRGQFRGGMVEVEAFVAKFEGEPGAGVFEIKSVAQSAFADVLESEVNMARCDASALGARLVPLEAGERGAPHFYPIPGYKVIPGMQGDQMERMLRLLAYSPVGAETFSDGENEDFETQCALAAKLIKYMGYEALVTTKPPKMEMRKDGVRPASRTPIGPADIAEKLGEIGAEYLERGWNPDEPVYLCRPMPLNGLPACLPFESIVHPRLLGFRLPSAMVHRAIEVKTAAAIERMR